MTPARLPRRSACAASALVALGLVACSGAPADDALDGPVVSIAVAPLALPAVADADWGLRVVNHSGDVVWERPSLRASSYGDGQSLAYVGPCDADPGEQPNRVELTLNGLYVAGGALMDPGSYDNPTVPTALSQSVVCDENQDTAVTFDVTLLRNASQGFFDVAVSFSDLFCSAKFDCSRDAGGAQPLELVHDPDGGGRLPSAVLAFACTGGVDSDTHLYLDDVTLTCDTPATYDIDPSEGPGNVYTGAAGANPAPAGAPFVQVQIFRGAEQLTDGGGGDYAKLYWNIAVGLDLTGFTGTCTLSTTGTAAPGALTDFAPATGTTYPVIEYTIDPFITAGAVACAQNPVNGSGSDVTTSYLSGEPPHHFDHSLTSDGADGTTVATYAPAPTVVTPTDVISARAATVCTTRDGDSWCWGYNNWYNTSSPVTSATVTPYQRSFAGTVTTAEAGVHGSCAVVDATVWCWGSSETPYTMGATPVNTGITNAVDVGAGDIAYCALLATGDVDCVGQNTKYVVSGGESLHNVDQLDLNDHFGCARIGGQIWTWGRNNTGQGGAVGCGGGDTCLTSPIRIGSFDDAIDLTVGHASACALHDGGTVSCWGRNDFGQLGRGAVTPSVAPAPALATELPADVVAFDLGYSHLCVVTALGAVHCLGENLHGKIGNGLTSGNQLTAYEVPLPAQATEVALTSYNSCARLTTGDIYCWGRNSAGECGQGDTNSSVLTPVAVTGLP